MSSSYQAVAATGNEHQDSSHRTVIGFSISLALALLTALTLTFMVPNYRDVFSSFGTDIPSFSAMVLQGYLAVWLLPAAVIAVSVGWPNVNRRSTIARRVGLSSVLIVLPIALLGLYLPIIRLAAAV